MRLASCLQAEMPVTMLTLLLCAIDCRSQERRGQLQRKARSPGGANQQAGERLALCELPLIMKPARIGA